MSHLPRQEIRQLIQSKPPLVLNVPELTSAEFEECLQPDSLDLRIGVTVAAGLRVVDNKQPVWQIPPGEMAIIITKEIVALAPDMAAEVSPKNAVLNDGLLVLAAPHVDPGYVGPLTARIINLRSTPYTVSLHDLVLTIRFYRLTAATDRPYQENTSVDKKIDKALKESRDTFNRLFHREEEYVKTKDLGFATVREVVTWLGLLVPVLVIVLPFSLPFFWNLGKDLSSEYPALVNPVAALALVFILPLFVLYVRAILRVWRLL